jgi:hypothetical protein
MCLNKMGLCVQNTMIILGSTVNVIGGNIYGQLAREFSLDNKWNIHLSLKNHEESGYGLSLNLLTISYQSCESYTKRSGLVGKSNHVNPFTLGMWTMVSISKKSDHIPLQHYNHTNPTNAKIIQSLSSHGYFGYLGYYNAHPKRG